MRRKNLLWALLCPVAVFAASPVHNRVVDYVPAPGQFVNVLPEWEAEDDAMAMAHKAYQYMAVDGSPVTLGAWGGYVTVGFEKTIVNVPGMRDIYIEGNAFQASQSSTKGGSSEPGVVMVAYDINHNGQPDDDEWFEIAGSEYANSVHNYEVTYLRPSTDKDNISWTDNQGNSGTVNKMQWHTQPYWPQWLKGEPSLTFKGCRLPDNGKNEGTASDPYFVLTTFDYGYADNYPNFSDNEGLVRNQGAMIDIDWAVDKNGNSVKMPGVDFVRIYTGVNQSNGMLGENSTEVCRVINCHTVTVEGEEVVDDAVKINDAVLSDFLTRYGGVDTVDSDDVRLYFDSKSGEVLFTLVASSRVCVYDQSGRCLMSRAVHAGKESVCLAEYPSGLYIVTVAGKAIKVLKK